MVDGAASRSMLTTHLTNMSGTLDLDAMSSDVGDASSLSAHDLTVLDAAVWYDQTLPLHDPRPNKQKQERRSFDQKSWIHGGSEFSS